MKVTVVTKNIELTPALKDMVEKKVSKLDKYFESNVNAKATLSVQKNRHRVEVSIPFNGILLRAEEITDDMYKSIDKVEDKLERQIRKQRTKLSRRMNDSLRFGEIATDKYENEHEGEVVKTKRFAVKPMNVDEAILQMELIGHNFFVYKDADTNNVSVLYKRKDGDYGLLEPDYV
ncbi:ribosome-associated translation inhibitor RaiA [Clostridium sardiniense]|uniref:Ribosome hibernation promoting factor n=1 Tax=Clostridium sardiniense TaxID=29369 RepID=A0ABS7KYC4_CLOSR|nr:ribosome-associated translation inhibitor RaiA [Clostridium sardiniense]MBM7835764.1 putative sigma-54 modulation protein [Clostridium sardiniense]MBY0755764.1 ribosome-associated translation inhibitor RaiA [Clostridium sardiniense]MDQ0460008.1 putative sigma-54 modulation protein [Clostridium sardiniense]